MTKAKRAGKTYRRPSQRRAQETVDAVLDSVARLLKRGGVQAVTTNRIAEVAGVSIGSVYQYFPNKEAIYEALVERHLREMERITESKLVGHEAGSLDERVRALVEAMVAAHAVEPELHALLLAQVPQRADAERGERLREVFRAAIAAGSKERSARDVERMLFVLTNMVVALAHAAVLDRPPRMSLAAATDEAVRAVLAYLHA